MSTAQNRTFRLTQSDIDAAFEGNQFRLVYQPKVDLASQEVTGVEVFVRWQHPQMGVLPPGLFLDFMEAQERMADLTQWVLDESLKAAGQWRRQGHDWAVSINVAPVDLMREDFVNSVLAYASAHGVSRSGIVIEVPERALAQEPEAMLVALDELSESGVQVALDGGGIVPINLNSFESAPFHSIKVGGQAMLRLAERLGVNGAGAISARLRYARANGLEAVAVGAETEQTIHRLREVGFTAVQGIWIQRPLPLADLLQWDGRWAKGDAAMDIYARPQQVKREAPRVAAPLPIHQDIAFEPAEPVRAASSSVRAEPAAPKPSAFRKAKPQALAKSRDEEVVEDEESEDRGGAMAAVKNMGGLVERRAKRSAAPAQAQPAKRRESLMGSFFDV